MVGTLAMAIILQSSQQDWMVRRDYRATIKNLGHEILLSNGLVERRIQLEPFVGTTSILRLDSGEQFLRSIEPEALLTIDGKVRTLGGVSGVPNRAYLLTDWIKSLKPDSRTMTFKGIRQVAIEAPVPYQPLAGQKWPPTGKAIVLDFEHEGILAELKFEIFDNLPVIGKQLRIINKSGSQIRLDRCTSERLAMVEGESVVDTQPRWRLPNVSVFTSMAFGGMGLDGSAKCARWEPDPAFQTQVNYELKTPCILDIQPPVGPGLDINPGGSVDSVRSYVIFHDSDDRERRTMGNRKFLRTMAPWTEQNPIIFHLRTTDDRAVRHGIDQAADCGFELVILSFGSGLNMEDISPANLEKFKKLNDYATSKGVRLGGYSLLASRRIDDANDVINPATGKTGGTIFGNSPCLCSAWGLDYFERLKKFLSSTGFSCLEHDGNYPGDPCASTKHPGHRDLADSQWRQHELITKFYGWCRERNIYLNVPDFYFLNGSNKTGMGYRETNWSLPRDQQHLHMRQNMFDGSFDKAPSMGWMFVPLVEYQGGGAAATIEPLREHLADYEQHFANTFGFGVQACWRGVQLYDTSETREMVVRMVAWFKKYRAILESDIVHLRRADGRRLDYILHVNPDLQQKAMLVVYNPTNEPLKEEITVPLGYVGKPSVLQIREREGKTKKVGQRSPMHSISVTARVPAQGWTYFVFE